MAEQRAYIEFLKQTNIKSIHYHELNELRLTLTSQYQDTMKDVLISGEIQQQCCIKKILVNGKDHKITPGGKG